ncbi:MAG: ferritin family protein [Omnitrophica bacterium]|nr:ferritin family protein [Candidatus Omnitrophota bacterium]
MADIFSGSEIVELGVQIEVNGKDFYTALIGKAVSARAKEIFKYLADEEEKHIAKFREILDSVHKYEPKEAYPTEYFAYMSSLASGYVFTKKGKGTEIAKSAKTDKEAIDLGIGFEKDSINFYEGMKKIVPEEGLGIIGLLIDQEQDHVKKLTNLKSSL